MKLRRAVGVAIVVAGLVGAGALALAESEDKADDFSAAHLGDGMGEGSLWEMLSPEERAATKRAGLQFADADTASAKATPEEESKLDKAGKIGFSLLAVGLSLGAAAAPFLLF